jgi:hypothetical protein
MSNENKDNSMNHFSYINDRVQRITSALYRVTEMFSDNEPVKWLLRKDAVEIFNKLSALERSTLNERVKDMESASKVIDHLLHSLELASSGTFISHINFEVLKREYSAMRDFLTVNNTILLPTQEIDLQGALPAPASALSHTDELDGEEQMTDTNGLQITSPYQAVQVPEVKMPLSKKEERPLQLPPKDSSQIKNNIKLPATPVASEKSDKLEPVQKQEKVVEQLAKKLLVTKDDAAAERDNEARLARQKKILDFVKSNGWVGVGDVSVVFNKSISEKTIQREMAAMAEAGILRKAGDKRWRRYACV